MGPLGRHGARPEGFSDQPDLEARDRSMNPASAEWPQVDHITSLFPHW